MTRSGPYWGTTLSLLPGKRHMKQKEGQRVQLWAGTTGHMKQKGLGYQGL